jgi:uncharacterized protein (DUF1778 family)
MAKKKTDLRPITVRFTPEEKRLTEQNAAAAGLSVSRFLALTGSAAQQPVSDEEKKLYIKIVGALNRIGKNINDLAAATNAARRGSAVEPESSEIQTAGTELIKLVQAIRKRINL